MKTQKVVVAKIHESSNPEQKRLELRSETDRGTSLVSMFQNVEAYKEKRIVFQPIAINKLSEAGLQEGDDLGEKLGKNLAIRIVEKTTPFFEGQEPKKGPKSGIVLTTDGTPIYRIYELVDVNSGKEDEKIAHTNGAEVKAAEEAAVAAAEAGLAS
jgi:hypothetical protein